MYVNDWSNSGVSSRISILTNKASEPTAAKSRLNVTDLFYSLRI